MLQSHQSPGLRPIPEEKTGAMQELSSREIELWGDASPLKSEGEGIQIGIHETKS